MLDVNELFREDDELPSRLAEAQIMQQQVIEFNRQLAKGQSGSKISGQLHIVSVAV